MAKAEYRSSIRSKKLITDALVELLDEKPLDKITVTDIVKKADINRGTFYAHYASVSDVVNNIFQGAFEIIKNSIPNTSTPSSSDTKQMLTQLQTVMEQDLDFYQKIYSSDMYIQISELIDEVLLSFILEHEKNISNVPHEDFLFYTNFYCGGIIRLYREWFVGNVPISFDELTNRASILLEELQAHVMQ